MPTDLENLQTARSAILTALAANAGKPNYSIDGQQVSYDSLLDRLAKIDALIAAQEGYFEVSTEYR